MSVPSTRACDILDACVTEGGYAVLGFSQSSRLCPTTQMQEDGNWSHLFTVIKLKSKLINAAMIH